MGWSEFWHGMHGKLNRNEDLNKEEIIYILDSRNIKDYIIHEDLTVDVNGDVDLSDRDYKYIPIKFGKVSGDFDISDNELTSLKNSPYEVAGDFNIENNKLTTLDYAPKNINGNLKVSGNDFDDLIINEMIYDNQFFEQSNYSNTLKQYLTNRNLSEKLQAELPKQDDFRSIIDRKQIQDLHALILEKNKTVEIPETYISADKQKETIKDIQTINNEPLQQEAGLVNVAMTRKNKLKL